MSPVVILTLAWLLGIFIQGWLSLPPGWVAAEVAGSIGFALLAGLGNRQNLRGGRLPLMLPLATALLGLGALRLVVAAPSTGPDNVLYYLERDDVRLSGVVSAEPVYGERSGTFRLNVQQVLEVGASRPVAVSGEIFVRTASSAVYRRGDLLQLTGRLTEPKESSGDFPYRQWLARQNIYAEMNYPQARLLAVEQDFAVTRWLYRLSAALTGVITRFVPGEEGGLLNGILLGDKSGLSQSTRQAFNDSGVAHILAVSGSNISILVMLVTLVLQRFLRRHLVLWLALGIIVFYVLLVGPGPSVVRAGLMGALAVGGILLGREYSGLTGLAGAALLMTLWQPQVLMDISFQLSFMATLGLVLAQPWLERTRHWPAVVQEGLILTVAAELLTLPLVTFYFHRLSLVSLLTNSLVVPGIALIMASGGLMVLAGLLLGSWIPFVPQALGGVAWLFLAYVLAAVEFCAGLPFASVQLPAFHPVWMAVYYLLLGLVVWWRRSGRHNQGVGRVMQLAGTPARLAGILLLTGLAGVAIWLI